MVPVAAIKYKFRDTFSSLGHKNFRYFWIGQCISLMGTWMQRAAQVWLVYNLTKSPLLLGLLGVFQFGPLLLFSLFAGVYIDRFPKRKILIFTQVVFMVQALALALLVYLGNVRYWEILVLAAVFGVIQTIDLPARQAFFVELVGKEDLMNAISLNSTIFNLAKIVGPALAGVIMTMFGPTVCFFVNGISFIAVLIGLFLIDVDGAVQYRKDMNIIEDIKQGLIYIWNNQMLKIGVLSMAIVCTFSMNTDVIIPVFAKEVLGRGTAEYTVLLSFVGVGSFLGAIYMASKSRKGTSKAMLYKQALVGGIVQIIILFTKNYYLSILLVSVLGFFNLTFLNTANASLQLNSRDEYRGRVMSVYALLNNGSLPIGNLFAGAVMEKFGPGTGFPVCGVITLLLMLLMMAVMNRREILSI